MSKLQGKPFTVFELYQLLSRTISSNTEFADLHLTGVTLEMMVDCKEDAAELPAGLETAILAFDATLGLRIGMAKAYFMENADKSVEPTHPAPEKLQ